MKKILKKLRAIDTKWLNRVTDEEFTIVSQDDFNPDGVLIFGYETYRTGFKHGLYASAIFCMLGMAWGAIENALQKKGGK